MAFIKSQFPSGTPKYEYTCGVCRSSKILTKPVEDRVRSGNVQHGAGQKLMKWQ